MTALQALTPETRRILCAEAQGLTPHLGKSWLANVLNEASLPDYDHDLNAAHELEKMLEDCTLIYVENLKRLTYEEAPHAISYDEYCAKELEWCGDVFATAEQRVSAFLLARNLATL